MRSTTSGYPDCRPEFIRAFESMANLATKAGVEGRQKLKIHAPLIHMTKAEIVRKGLELGVDFSLTSSCYDPAQDGAPCGECDSCILRRKGFRENGIEDPLVYRGRPRTGSAMSYAVKEIFLTLQGEGAQTGRAAVFCRFSGCNLWSGREQDRAAAVCRFCDTDFADIDGPGGGKFTDADALADAIASKWPAHERQSKQFVVCTGGEPLLQLDEPLIRALHARDFEIAVETNGTLEAPGQPGLDLRQSQSWRALCAANRR